MFVFRSLKAGFEATKAGISRGGECFLDFWILVVVVWEVFLLYGFVLIPRCTCIGFRLLPSKLCSISGPWRSAARRQTPESPVEVSVYSSFNFFYWLFVRCCCGVFVFLYVFLCFLCSLFITCVVVLLNISEQRGRHTGIEEFRHCSKDVLVATDVVSKVLDFQVGGGRGWRINFAGSYRFKAQVVMVIFPRSS